jgi:hypothetical protein
VNMTKQLEECWSVVHFLFMVPLFSKKHPTVFAVKNRLPWMRIPHNWWTRHTKKKMPIPKDFAIVSAAPFPHSQHYGLNSRIRPMAFIISIPAFVTLSARADT